MKPLTIPLLTLALTPMLCAWGGGGFSTGGTNHTSYYLDATAGDNGYTGTSRGDPWETIAQLETASPNPSDEVYLKSGETWREQLDLPSTGSLGNPITYASYGTGAAPIVTGFDVISSWTLDAGARYKKVLAPTPANDVVTVVLEDGSEWYTLAANAAAVDASSEYYYDGVDTLYIQTSDDANPSTHTIEVSVRSHAIAMCGAPYGSCGRSYQVFSGLHTTGASSGCIFFNDADYYTVSNSTIEYCGEYGIYHRNNGVGTADGLTVTNNTVRYIGTDPTDEDPTHDAGVLAEGVNDAIITDNTISTTYGPGIRVTAQAGEADVTGGEVESNTVSAAMDGIYVYRATAPIVRYNHVYDGYNIGIFIGQDSDGANVHYNLIHDLTTITGTAGFNGIDINSASDGFAYNNTIYAISGGSIIIDEAGASADTWTFRNNILDASANTDPGVGPSAFSMHMDTGLTGIDSDYNLHYFPNPGNENGDCLSWIGTNYDYDDFATFVTAKSQEANGIGCEVDPLLTDPATNDFTLDTGSPAENTGVDVSLTRDILGNPIVGIPDMGAYEVQ